MSDLVTMTLAHPLTAEQADRLHAKDAGKTYRQGDKITLPRDDARLLVNAGYAAGVDPADHDAVRSALKPGAAGKAAKSGS